MSLRPKTGHPPRKDEVVNGQQRRALESLELAVERWQNALLVSDDLGVSYDVVRYATIGEALFWGGALRETLPKSHDDDLCRGLRFARNRVTHDLIEPAEAQPGVVFPVVLPVVLHHYVWRDASRIPVPSGRPGAKVDRSGYEAEWQGRVVDQVFGSLVQHLRSSLGG